jgi:hypothetical protein
MEKTVTNPAIYRIRYNSSGTCYDYTFPYPEMANFIALVGWTVTNYMQKTPEVRKALDEVEALSEANGGLDIPDGREWYRKYATIVNE